MAGQATSCMTRPTANCDAPARRKTLFDERFDGGSPAPRHANAWTSSNAPAESEILIDSAISRGRGVDGRASGPGSAMPGSGRATVRSV